MHLDRSGRIRSLSRQAGRLFGVPPKELMGTTLADRMLAGERPLPTAAEGFTVPCGATLLLVRADGTQVPVTLGVHVDGDGIDVTIQDVSADHREAEHIRKQVGQLREAQAVGGIGSWEWDVPADTVYWSDQLYRIYGLPPGGTGPTYQAFLDFIHPDDRGRLDARIKQAFQDHGPFSFDHRIVTADGRERILHGQGDVVTDEKGAVVRMYGVAQDITEIKHTEEADRIALERKLMIHHLQDMGEAKNRLLRMVSHEIYTPLTPLRLQVHQLKERLAGPLNEKQGRALTIIDRNVDRLQRLVADVLAMSRMESGKFRLHLEPITLEQVVQEVVDEFQPAYRKENVVLGVRMHGDLGLNADRARLVQVVYNLLSNALKFTEPGGHVVLEAHKEDDHMVLTVTDDGEGITQDAIDDLFEPFGQIHDPGGPAGTGLGLHISKGIVEQHGGRISCTSQGPGHGTCFTVRLPVDGPPASDVAPAGPAYGGRDE